MSQWKPKWQRRSPCPWSTSWRPWWLFSRWQGPWSLCNRSRLEFRCAHLPKMGQWRPAHPSGERIRVWTGSLVHWRKQLRCYWPTNTRQVLHSGSETMTTSESQTKTDIRLIISVKTSFKLLNRNPQHQLQLLDEEVRLLPDKLIGFLSLPICSQHHFLLIISLIFMFSILCLFTFTKCYWCVCACMCACVYVCMLGLGVMWAIKTI